MTHFSIWQTCTCVAPCCTTILVRAVCYQLSEVDWWCSAVQAALNVVPACVRGLLLRHIYESLAPPLDERFRMLHPWLEPKQDDVYSAPYGPRDQWHTA